MPSPKSVYLAGPITGLSYGEARHGWREQFAAILKVQSPHIECYSPMRAKEFLSTEQSLKCSGADLEGVKNAISQPRGILTRDANDVASRDVVVANFSGAKIVSIGTVWEMGRAFTLGKPVILIMENPRYITREKETKTENVSAYIHSNGREALGRYLVSLGHDISGCEIVSQVARPEYGDYSVTFTIAGKKELVQNVHEHIFVTHTAGYRVETLEEAALILGSLLTPGI